MLIPIANKNSSAGNGEMAKLKFATVDFRIYYSEYRS